MAVDYAALKAGGFMRQKQKNTFSLRLRVVGGTLTPEQLSTIIAVAKQYGHDYVHLTSRQGVEIPFIKLEDIEEVKASLRASAAPEGGRSPPARQANAVPAAVLTPMPSPRGWTSVTLAASCPTSSSSASPAARTTA